jgi:type II secretory ATPase GspE/PulE/Tfp pilus assembly ATPase PilB-like protein
LQAPHGLILIAGPPGSGRTTVAYAMLHALAEEHGDAWNIMAVESVCEFWLGRGVSQIVLDRKMGMTYSDALGSIMRQDLDAVMVDEIDSPETARTCLNVALTGHLVIGVMRAHDVIHAITRLREWDIDPFSLSSELIGAIGVRLTRKICSMCSEPYQPLPHILQQLNISPEEAGKVRRGKGCDHCRRGLAGRLGIYEVLADDGNVSGLLLRESDTDELRHAAFPDGKGSLQDTAKNSVLSGLTTPEEALRALVVKW